MGDARPPIGRPQAPQFKPLRIAAVCATFAHPTWLGSRLARLTTDRLYGLANTGHHVTAIAPLLDGLHPFKAPKQSQGGLSLASGRLTAHYVKAEPMDTGPKADLSARLPAILEKADALVLYGGYSPMHAHAAKLAKDAGHAYVVDLLGDLSQTTLEQTGLIRGRHLKKNVTPLLMGADTVIAESDATAEMINAWNWQVSLETCPIGMDIAVYRQPATPVIDGGYVLSLGPITASRRLDLLIEALTLTKGAGKALRLVLAGPDHEGHGAELLAMAQRGKVADRVVMTGYVPESKKLSLLRHAALFAQPMNEQPFSYAMLEAVAAGVPLLRGEGSAVHVPAPEATQGVRPDGKSWAKAIDALADDGDARKALAKKASAGAGLAGVLSVDEAMTRYTGVLRKVKARIG